MRTLTSGQLAILDGVAYQVGLRVLVTDGDGVYRDYSSQAGHNWIIGVDITVDIDQPISQATIKLRRDIKDNSGSVLSLSPLRTDSILNRNAALAFAPAIDGGRNVKVLVATVAVGATITSGDWQNLFEGIIDTHDVTTSTMSLSCRDLGGVLADRFFETEQTYGSATGIPAETVMQQMLNNAFGPGVYTLYCPTSPGFDVTPYPVSKVSVMDALQALAAKFGWDVRFKWDSGASAWRLTLWVVDRSKTTPDRTISPSRYFDVTNLTIDRTNIRNALTGTYYDSALGSVQPITRTDPTSIGEYGRMWAEFDEGSDSPIDTAAEMTAMLDAALADLKDPKADQSIVRLFDWSIELGDLDQYLPNGRHYNTAQDWAVVGYQHSLSPTQQRTTIAARGAPAGKYLDWLSRSRSPEPSAAPTLTIENLRVIAESPTSVTYGWTPSAGVVDVWCAVQTFQSPVPDDPWGIVSAVVQPLTANTITIAKPPEGWVTYVQLEPRDANLLPGQVERITVMPGALQPPVWVVDDIEGPSSGTQYVQFVERGLAITAVEFRTQIGSSQITEWGPPSRGPGAVSVVTGDVLGPLAYEHDIGLDPSRLSYIQARITLSNGQQQVIDFAPFDRDKAPNIISAVVVGTVITANGDSDTRSWRVTDPSGTWEYVIDGPNVTVDVAKPGTNGVAGLLPSATHAYRITAYSDPSAYVSGNTLTDERDIQVGGPDAPSGPASWLTDTTVLAPLDGTADVRLNLHVSAAPAGYSIVVSEAFKSGVFTDVTADLIPLISTLPTTLTTYSKTTGWSAYSGTLSAELVTYTYRLDLVDATGVVVDTLTKPVSWYVFRPPVLF